MALQICKYTFDMEIVRVLTFSTVCQQSTKNMVITNRFLNIEKRFNWKMFYLTWTRARYWWLFMKYFREHLRTIFLSILWITWMNQKNPFLYTLFFMFWFQCFKSISLGQFWFLILIVWSRQIWFASCSIWKAHFSITWFVIGYRVSNWLETSIVRNDPIENLLLLLIFSSWRRILLSIYITFVAY